MIPSILRRGELSEKIFKFLKEKNNVGFMHHMQRTISNKHIKPFFFQTITIVISEKRRKEFLEKYEHMYEYV